MRYYKQIDGDYIIAIGTGLGGTEIAESEYNSILSAIQNKPRPTETTDYILKTDLTWESYEIEPVDSESTEEDYAAAGHILMGEGDRT